MKSLPAGHRRPMIAQMKRLGYAVSMLFVCLFLLASPGAHCQTTTNNIMNVDDTTSTPRRGTGHDYIHMLSETVNPANGSVSLRIELPVPKGRGISPSFSINYDSDSVQHLDPGSTPGTVGWVSDGDNNSASNTTSPPGGWSFGVPSLYYSEWQVTKGSPPNLYTCNAYSNYMFMDLSGELHALNIGTENSLVGGICDDGYQQGGDTQVAAAFTEGPMNPLDPASFLNLPVKVYTPDGTVYTFTGISPSTNKYTTLPSTVEDRNGNILTYIDNGSTGVLIYDNFTVQDTAGRTVIASSGGNTSETLTVGGLTYQILWTTVSANASISSQWAGYSGGPAQYGPSGQDSCIGGFPSSMQDTQRAISQIELPNGQSYRFSYNDPYGLISEIDYPTGAWVKYTWKPSDNFNELADYPGMESEDEACTDPSCGSPYVTVQLPVINGCLYKYAGPVVATRQVGFTAGGAAAQTQTFTPYSTSWGTLGTADGIRWSQKTTAVATTDNVRNQSATTNYTYSPFYASSNDPLDDSTFLPEIPLEQEIVYHDYNGNLLETVDKTWANQYQPLTITTTPAGGLASTVTYGYITSGLFSLMTGKNEYDGVTQSNHTTSTTYQQFTGTPGDLVNRPCSVVICSSGTSCTSANRIAETDYLYDGGSSVCGAAGGASTSSVSGGALPTGTHDETLFGSGSNTPRGNVTEQINFANSGSSPITAYTYDETGHILSMTDPKSNTTQYSYTDSPSGGNPNGNSNAYLTQITYPTVNGITPKKSFSYDYSLGYLTQYKDENGQLTDLATIYKYNNPPAGCSDVLDRLGEVDYPDGGKTTYCYNDAALTTTTTTLQAPNPSKITATTTDGVGHVIETQLTSDPQGADTVVTTYDGEGRVYTVTNPYRTTGDSTYGVTTYTYDALNRMRTLQNYDTTGKKWIYNGNTVDYYDETFRHWQRTYDAFQQPTKVLEPDANNNPTIETDYQYGTLNNLIRVDQWGGPSGSSGDRVRTFTYDSLSRLTAANNPESGTTTYSYLNSSGGCVPEIPATSARRRTRATLQRRMPMTR